VNRTAPTHRLTKSRVADQIVESLRERILTGALPDGTRLPAERELAEEYGVSGATVRESVRVLSAMGLVSVQHGSGSFVTAETDTMVGLSIASVVRLAGAGVTEVLGVLAALNRYAAVLAVREATDAEIASLRATADQLAVVEDVPTAARALRDYLRGLSELSHNPLLIALCRYLADIQVELALETSGGELEGWRRVVGALHPDRVALVEALEARDADRAAAVVDAHTERAVEVILSTHRSRDAHGAAGADPDFARLLSALLQRR
jgi:GntR family transcriptional regulator, transcriptional repressor for pyruvate dehydrogenase complex